MKKIVLIMGLITILVSGVKFVEAHKDTNGLAQDDARPPRAIIQT
jgi:hypothetical protein